MNKRSGVTLAIVAVAIIVVGGLFLYMRSNSDDKSTTNNTSQDNSSDQKTASENATTSPQDSEAQTPSNSSQTTGNAQAAKAVTIDDMAFSPKEITVKVGTTVTWTNQDTVSHDVKDDNNSADGPSSEMLGQGESYSFTFKKAGTYNYHCTPHPFMKATVIVTE